LIVTAGEIEDLLAVKPVILDAVDGQYLEEELGIELIQVGSNRISGSIFSRTRSRFTTSRSKV
jgi:hypothetical protein